MKKKVRNGLLASLVVLASVSIYSMQSADAVPEVSKVEAVSSEGVFVLPQIFAIGPNGPQQSFNTDLFIDFHDLPSPSYHPGAQFSWSSSPAIPGMTSAGSNTLLKTVYIPSNTPSGEYTVTATNTSTGEFTSATFTINGTSGGSGGGGAGGGIIKTQE